MILHLAIKIYVSALYDIKKFGLMFKLGFKVCCYFMSNSTGIMGMKTLNASTPVIWGQ